VQCYGPLIRHMLPASVFRTECISRLYKFLPLRPKLRLELKLAIRISVIPGNPLYLKFYIDSPGIERQPVTSEDGD
jgi:hypothetical protein